MSWDPRDYLGETFESEGRACQVEEEKAQEELAERMAAFDAGLCSLGAAYEGGERYRRDLAESMTELTEVFGSRHIAEPVAVAIASWREGQRIAGRMAA